MVKISGILVEMSMKDTSQQFDKVKDIRSFIFSVRVYQQVQYVSWDDLRSLQHLLLCLLSVSLYQ